MGTRKNLIIDGFEYNNHRYNYVSDSPLVKVVRVDNNHASKGTSTFPNNIKNFYFARVVSDLDNYPRVNLNISPLVRTPLNVDIYCKTNIPIIKQKETYSIIRV